MPRIATTTVVTYSLLAFAGIVSLSLPPSLSIREAIATPVDYDMIRLNGTVRDFKSDHPDFGTTASADTGHYAHNTSPTLAPDGRPAFVGAGSKVNEQWYDRDGNPIMPSDAGLPGGHFDVDIFDSPNSTKKRYHCHEFDDKYDVTFVDLVEDSNLLFDAIIGFDNTDELMIEFHNVNMGTGWYTFQAGGSLESGAVRDGFTTTFTPSELTRFIVRFASLDEMRGTEPGKVQKDASNRDGAWSIHIKNDAGDIFYELAVYHHVSKKAEKVEAPVAEDDSCGTPIKDTLGSYSTTGNGAVTDSGSFENWFHDSLGNNISSSHGISLRKNPEGVYEYLTDDFYPVEDRSFGNEGETHNNYFTYSISATFTYHACQGQFFEFEGNDDCWVYIDDKLAIDLGGTTTPERQYAAMDRLDLVDGEQYNLKFFYAQRRNESQSIFRMRTNLDLWTGVISPVSAGFD